MDVIQVKKYQLVYWDSNSATTFAGLLFNIVQGKLDLTFLNVVPQQLEKQISKSDLK
jgi:hypothetical protein